MGSRILSMTHHYESDKEVQMNKPQGYDQAQAGGSYTPIALGGHRAIIKQVLETTSRSGKDMIVVSIDFAAEDAQAKYFDFPVGK